RRHAETMLPPYAALFLSLDQRPRHHAGTRRQPGNRKPGPAGNAGAVPVSAAPAAGGGLTSREDMQRGNGNDDSGRAGGGRRGQRSEETRLNSSHVKNSYA